MKCNNCGTENIMEAKFCSNCGTKLINDPPKKNNNFSKLLIIFLIVVAIGFIFKVPKSLNGITNSSEANNTTKDNGGNNKNDITKVIDYNNTYDNYNISVEIITKVKGINIKSYTHGTVDEVNRKQYIETEVTTKSLIYVNVSSKTYTDFNTGYTYTYTDSTKDGKWRKSTGATKKVDLQEMLKNISRTKNVKAAGANHFKINLSPEEVKTILSGVVTEDAKITGNVDVDVYVDAGYITEVDCDFSKAVEDIDTLTTSVKITNHNKAGTVEIPQEIIDNAI